jgi:predicted nucleic acid-binding protein
VGELTRVVLDTNCFIDAVTPTAKAYPCMRRLLSIAELGRIRLMVSRHTLEELSKKPDPAYELAKTVEVAPYWPVGTISEQVATIGQLTGTWDDARQNQEIQEEVKQLAKSGTDVRDRGAYLDALRTGADAFVTSDRHLAGSVPAGKIRAKFGLRVLTPCELASESSL